MGSTVDTAARADILLEQANSAFTRTGEAAGGEIRLGVDLGTASVVLVALDSEGIPLAGELQEAKVVRDGLVVDYIGAAAVVRKLKERLEKRLGVPLARAAIAVPPGTSTADAGAHRYVVESCGLEVDAVVDEPTAANAVLGIRNGAVVDIGGGTTGLTVFREGEAVYTADEATGGTHISLVLMGAQGLSFAQAEARKRDPARAKDTLGLVKPVIEKMASIVERHIRPFPVDSICLVGGTCCLPGVERVVEQYLDIPAVKPAYPMLVTPLGIALHSGRG